MKWVLISLLTLIIAGAIIINTDWGQNFLVDIVTRKLSKNLNTKINIKHISLSLFNKMNIEGVLVEDQKKDTLFSAGVVQVRITDWFFLKDKIVLKYAGLEDAVINLNRTDSIWNYQFLIDYFSGGPSTGQSKNAVEFDLKKIKLRNIAFNKKDAWRGEDMILQLSAMDLDADEINFATKKIKINSLDFTDPAFSIKNYPGLRPKRKTTTISEDQENIVEKNDTTLTWNSAGWLVNINKLKIENGDFKNIKESSTPYFEYFDGRNIDFANINGVFSGISVYRDTLTTSINLSTKERSGFEVKSMVAKGKLTPKEMTFSDLEIKTNNSIIRDYFSMNFEDFSDMSDFITLIRMKARFDEAEIDSDDIAFFAPELKQWKKKIKISGQALGTVDDIFGNELIIEAGKNTYLNGNVSLTGLPDINKTFIDFKANTLRTNYNDVATFLPVIKNVQTPNLKNISYLYFNGNFTGFIKDFVTYGTIRTNLGTITSDLNMKLPDGKLPFYSGNIASKDFNFGKFFNDPKFGLISFSGQVKGRGLQLNNIDAEVDANIDQLTYNNYHYENIITQGSLGNKIFNGNFSVRDTNASISLNGLIDLSSKVPRFNFVADIDTLNLKPLNLMKENYSFSGKLDFDFTADNIDNFLGRANVRNALIKKDDKLIPIDSLLINSEYVDHVKHLTVFSNEFEAKLNGDFYLTELPESFKLFLNKYYPSYIKPITGKINDQAFDFDIRTNYVSEIINLIDSSLQGFDNAYISGRLDTRQNQMALDTDVPSFAYKQYEFQNVKINGLGNLKELALTGVIDYLKVSDSVSFPLTKIDLVAKNDSTKFKLVTQSSNKNIPGGSINALVTTYNDGVAVKFDSSNFVINGKRWTIEENGELEIRSKAVSNSQIVLRESNQEINIHTVPSGIGDWNDIKIDIKNFNIGDVTSLFVKSNQFEGLATGNITIEDPVKTFNVISDIKTDQLRIDNDSIGELKTHVFYNNKTGKLKVTGNNLNLNEKLSYDMDLFLKDVTNSPDDVITVKFDNYNISIVERFINTLFSDLTGYGTGQLMISGKGANRKYIGKAKVRDAGIKVIFTQCYYKFKDAEVNFKEDALDLGKLTLIDTVTNNTATLSTGIIKHNSWRDLEFNIKAKVDNNPMLLLNTTARDNSSFYGYAKGTGSFELTGPQSNMKIKIVGKASETDSSYITIPNTSSRESGIADFLIERKYGRELTDSVKSGNITDLTYDVDLTGNPLVNVRVVIDELTNDEIRGRGVGNLRILSGTSEPLTMRGRYDINEGHYRFTFQSFFKKPFELNKAADNYIEWNGDPYHPTVNIEAIYKTEKKVDFTPIVRSSLGSDVTGIRDYVYVIAKLKGDLFKPDISFSLDFPPESLPKRDVQVSFVVNQLQQNENELNKQVAFLVVFNSFAPTDVGSSLSVTSGFDIVVNSISGFLSSQINNVLNDILSNKLKIPGLYVNFSGSLYDPRPFKDNVDEGGLNYDRATSLNLSVAKSLFNNRVVVTFEGNYDVPFQTTTTQFKSDLLTNFTTEFLINKSGTIRATIFYKENVDFLTGNTTGTGKARRYGTSLAFRKSFNKLGELFRRKKATATSLPVKTEIEENN